MVVIDNHAVKETDNRCGEVVVEMGCEWRQVLFLTVRHELAGGVLGHEPVSLVSVTAGLQLEAGGIEDLVRSEEWWTWRESDGGKLGHTCHEHGGIS